MGDQELSDLCRSIGLSLTVDRTKDDDYGVFRQLHGSEPPEVSYRGSRAQVVTYVLGYIAGLSRGRRAVHALKTQVLDAVRDVEV